MGWGDGDPYYFDNQNVVAIIVANGSNTAVNSAVVGFT